MENETVKAVVTVKLSKYNKGENEPYEVIQSTCVVPKEEVDKLCQSQQQG